jgi:hypothetical protein
MVNLCIARNAMASFPEEPGTELLPFEEAGPDANAHEGVDVPGLPKLPRELGVILISAGVVGFVMPGPGTPAIIAGGLVLWPKGFGKAEVWFRRRFPSLHRDGMQQIRRFLADLERRYPGPVG